MPAHPKLRSFRSQYDQNPRQIASRTAAPGHPAESRDLWSRYDHRSRNLGEYPIR